MGRAAADRRAAARAVLAGHLTADPEALAGRIRAAILAEVPEYAGLAGEARERAVEGIRATTRLLVGRLARAAAAFTAADQAMLESFGAQRAAHRLPAEAVRTAVQVGFRLVWAELVQQAYGLAAAADGAEVHGAAPEDVVAALGQLGQQVVALERDAVRAMLLGHTDQCAEHRGSTVTDRISFLTDLLAGGYDGLDPPVIPDAYEAGTCYGLVLVTPHGDNPHPADVLRLARAQLSPRRLDALAAVRRTPVPHLTVLAPVAEPEHWTTITGQAQRLCAQHRLVGVTVEPVDAGLVHRSYQRAVTLLALAARVSPQPGLVDGDDLAVYRLLAAADRTDPDGCRDLLEPTAEQLRALPPERRRIVEETVAGIYAANGDVTNTTTALGISAHTLRWRIREVSGWTGLSLGLPADRLKLELAVRWLRLRND